MAGVQKLGATKIKNNNLENVESWFVLGNGVEISCQEIEFLPNLKIRQIENPISVFDLAAAGAKGFREWAMLEPISSSCRIEILSINEGVNSGYDVLNRAWLLNTLLVLRRLLRINSLACSSYSWREIAGHQKRSVGKNIQLPRFQGSLLDYHPRMIQLPKLEKTKIDKIDVKWITNNFETANHLASKDNNFRFALETINSWRYAKDLKSAIAIIWAAIESIIGVSSEIVFRISLNISSLLETRGESRLKKFNEIKKIYGLRSKVVHGSELKSSQVDVAIEGSFAILADLLIYMIEKNKVISESDFEKAIFY